METVEEVDTKNKPSSITLAISIGLSVLSYLVVLGSGILRHNSELLINYKVKSCSSIDWIVLGGAQALLLIIAMLSYAMNRNQFTSDVSENPKAPVILVSSGYFTGVAAGTIGIGGGMALNPIMISLGIDPLVTSALCGYVVLFSSSGTATQFTLIGAIHIRHAVWFMGLSFLGSIIGIAGLRSLVNRWKKPSVILWVILIVMVIAAIVLPVQIISIGLNDFNSMLTFGSVCRP